MANLISNTAPIQPLKAITARSVAINHTTLEDRFDELPNPVKNDLLNLLTKRGIVNEKSLKNLLNKDTKRLELINCKLSEESIKHIRNCINLKALQMECDPSSDFQITDKSLMAIFPSLKYLQAIQLRRCSLLTDVSIESLTVSCGRFLLCVNLTGCVNIGDRSLFHFATNCPRLTSLSLKNTAVTPNGIFRLSQAPCCQTLKEICVDCCLEMDDEAIEALAMSCPNLNILTFSGCPKLTEQSRQIIEEIQRSTKNIKHISWTIY